MTNTGWTQSSDERNCELDRFDRRAACVVWIAERLDESERLMAQDQDATACQSFDAACAAAETGPAPVAARVRLAAALVAAGLMLVHLIAG